MNTLMKPHLSHWQSEKTHELGGDETPAVPAIPGRCNTILILEDEGKLTGVLQRYFVERNFRITCVKNGVEGLKCIMAHDYDVILCDMLMPNLPGDMFYVAVQRVKPHLCKRFIFMTGHKGDRKIDQFLREIRGIMIWKPFQPHELLETVEAVLKKSRQSD